ncbi:FecR family protein [Pedobacter sp.]|uniref:FecR family protein n=1 Tax=Pedobacter sp. TaxID=1411316 RepID=UPI003D7FBD45
MMKESELNDGLICSLIIESIDQTITPENKILLDSWRNADKANERVFQDYVNVQVNLDKINSKYRYDTQSSWESLDKKLHIRQKTVFPWYKLAAAVLIILSVGYYFLDSNSKYVVINTKDNSLTALTLPDGTQVNMNKATTIRYNKKNFTTDRRLELLKGEVFIHVINHHAPQFVVDMGNVDAKDIGTSFNVLRNDKEVSIIVADGSVALRHLESKQQVLLKKGQVGLYSVHTEKLRSANNSNVNYKAWVDKKFIFNEVPFEEVAVQLEKVYQTTISINGNKLKNRKLTAKLHYQNIDSAMAVISASLQCKVTKDKDTYVLSDL